MSIFEYDQEKHMRQEREQHWEEGHQAGLAEGHQTGLAEGIRQGEEKLLLEQIRKKLAKGKSYARVAEELEEEEGKIRQLAKKLGNFI